MRSIDFNKINLQINTNIMKQLIGKQVIVRANRAGVFFGILNNFENRDVELLKCRKLYYWSGASETLQLSVEGVKNPQNCKFTIEVEQIFIKDTIEVIPCTEKAIVNINSVPVWKL